MKWRNNSELLSSSGEQPELLFLGAPGMGAI